MLGLAVISVPSSSELNVFRIRKLIFFSTKGIIVLACRTEVPKLANSLASLNDNSLICFASGTKTGSAV